MSTRLLSRRWIYPTLAAVAIALVGLNPSWAKAVGVDVWNLPTLEQEVHDATETSKELTLIGSDIQERIVAKEMKIEELKAGRRTLADVTDEFLALNESRPGYMTVIRMQYEGRTDREKVARNVIHYVKARMEDPTEEAAVLTQLDAELNEMYPTDAPLTP